MSAKAVILIEVLKHLLESSDSDSSSEENELLLMAMINEKHSRARSMNYVEHVVPLYLDKDFQMHFQ